MCSQFGQVYVHKEQSLRYRSRIQASVPTAQDLCKNGVMGEMCVKEGDTLLVAQVQRFLLLAPPCNLDSERPPSRN